MGSNEASETDRHERRRKYRADYYRANAEDGKAKARAWRLANLERARINKAKYRKSHPKERVVKHRVCACGAPMGTRSQRCQECNVLRDRERERGYRARAAATRSATPKSPKLCRCGAITSGPRSPRCEECRTQRREEVSVAYYARHAEDARRRAKEWREAHQERYREARREKKHIRRARERSSVGNVSPGIRQILAKRQRNKCVACQVDLRQSGSHLDHIIPIAKGGPHDDANLQLLCPSCNTRKQAKDPVVFMQQMGFLL